MLVVTKDKSIGNATGYWASNYIDYGRNNNWLDMVTTESTSALNRYETCRIIINYIGDTETYPDNIMDYARYLNDYDSIPEAYKLPVLKTVYLGIITGYPDGTFTGSNILNRAEAAVIIHRVIDRNYRRLPLSIETAEVLAETFEDLEYIQDHETLGKTVIFEENKLKFDDEGQYITVSQSDVETPLVSLTEQVLQTVIAYDHTNEDDNSYYLLKYTGHGFAAMFVDIETEKYTYRFYVAEEDNSFIITINPHTMTTADYDTFYKGLTESICTKMNSSDSTEIAGFLNRTTELMLEYPYAVMDITKEYDDFTINASKDPTMSATYRITPK